MFYACHFHKIGKFYAMIWIVDIDIDNVTLKLGQHTFFDIIFQKLLYGKRKKNTISRNEKKRKHPGNCNNNQNNKQTFLNLWFGRNNKNETDIEIKWSFQICYTNVCNIILNLLYSFYFLSLLICVENSNYNWNQFFYAISRWTGFPW